MTNLLPLEAKKRIWHGYLARFLAAAACALFALAILFALALTPSYAAILLNAPDSGQATEATTTQSEVNTIARTQTLVRQLLPILAGTTTPSSVALAAALSDLPEGATLDQISYAVDAKGGVQLTLSGNASREKIAAYKTALSSDPLFSNVFVPVAALVGSEDGTFSVTLNVTGHAL
jgi:hypothetical protein